MQSKERARPPQNAGKVRWLVLASAYFSVVVNVGFFYSISMLFVDIRKTFGTTRAETATIHSTAIGFGLGSGIIYGLIISRLGARASALLAASLATFGMAISFFATSVTFLVISIGIVTAAGLACIYIASSAIVGQHFRGKAAVPALTLLATGSSIGGTIYPYIIGYLLDTYGLRGAMLLLSGIIMQTIPATAIWVPPEDSNHGPISLLDSCSDFHNISIFTITALNCKNAFLEYGKTIIHVQYASDNQQVNEVLNKDIAEEVQRNPNRQYCAVIIQTEADNDKTPEGAWNSVIVQFKNKVFVMYAVAVALSNAALTVFLVFIVDYFVDRGFTQSNASLGLLLVNISSLIGRMTPAILLQFFTLPIFTPPVSSTILGIIAMSLISFTDSFEVLLLLSCVIGLCLGLMVTTFTVTTRLLVGVDTLASAIGVVFSLNGLANLISGPVSGLIRDRTGSYNAPFLGSMAPMVLGLVLLLLAQRLHNRGQAARNRPPSLTFISKL